MECVKGFYFEPIKHDHLSGSSHPLPNSKQTSLSTLVSWNISKAKEKNPDLEIKDAIATAQRRLEQVSDAHELEAILAENPYTRYLACALLAWQQLGHSNVDSLCRFVEKQKFEEEFASKLESKSVPPKSESISRISRESKLAKAVETSSIFSNEMGPVVKLPVETKIVMRVESAQTRCSGVKKNSNAPERNYIECGTMGCQTVSRKSKEPERNHTECGPTRCPVIVTKTKVPARNIMDKIDKACCLDSKCSEHLLEMGKSIKDLKNRVMLLARREADRIELIERAEEAWRDLEMSYQRRLRHAEEKELDLVTQIERSVAERNKHKNDCTPLAERLKKMGKLSEVDNARLNDIEKELYDLACERVKLSQECAKGEAGVAERACKAAQLDRDHQFKEEQARRKLQTLRTEVDSAAVITHETERALRAELSAIRDQLAEVSKQLLAEDSETEKVKLILEELRQEKMDMIDDLEGCKEMCDSRVQGLVDEIKSKNEKLAELKEKVLECRCKVPVNANVEVKRTPSFAALCSCTSADKMKASCSCTSMRGRLMTDVLATLFGGLQAEMGTTVTQMSCQLLKCLEDKHNWDKVTVVKTNLKAYFSKLLAGELDIAIATSIEKYHAKWVGLSCADSLNPETREAEIERRAKSLASQLAEQLFQEKSNELEQRAKDLIASGPPPCNCKPTTIESVPVQSRALPCMVKNRPASRAISGSPTPIFWHRVTQDVTQLRQQPKAEPPDCNEGDERGERLRTKNASRIPALNADVKVNDAKEAKVAASNAVAFPFLAKNKLMTNIVAGSASPIYWHQAMLDVTKLRLQVESLQKDSLKKEDLKAMEDKLANIIEHASGSRLLTGARTDHLNSGNVVNKAIKKVQKTNRAVNHSGLHIFDIKSTTTKRNNIDTRDSLQIKKRSNFLIRNGVDRTFTNKRNENTYAVNMCLCNTKNHQKISKNTVSQRASNNKTKSKPLNTNYISQDISQRNSKESDEQSCASNCACFNKIPSNTSIDKLLQTLVKWKCDLDASCNDKLFTQNTSDDDNVSLNSETSERYRGIYQGNPATTKQESLSDLERKPLNTSKTSKQSEKNMVDAKSEYMDAKSQKYLITKTHDNFSDQEIEPKIDLNDSELCDCNPNSNKTSKESKVNSAESKTSKNSKNISAKSPGPNGTTEFEYVIAKPQQKPIIKKYESLYDQGTEPQTSINLNKLYLSKNSKDSEKKCVISMGPNQITASENMEEKSQKIIMPTKHESLSDPRSASKIDFIKSENNSYGIKLGDKICTMSTCSNEIKEYEAKLHNKLVTNKHESPNNQGGIPKDDLSNSGKKTYNRTTSKDSEKYSAAATSPNGITESEYMEAKAQTNSIIKTHEIISGQDSKNIEMDDSELCDCHSYNASKTLRNLKENSDGSKTSKSSKKKYVMSTEPNGTTGYEYMEGKSQTKPMTNIHESLSDQDSKPNIVINHSYVREKSISSEKICAKSTGPIENTESDYTSMRAKSQKKPVNENNSCVSNKLKRSELNSNVRKTTKNFEKTSMTSTDPKRTTESEYMAAKSPKKRLTIKRESLNDQGNKPKIDINSLYEGKMKCLKKKCVNSTGLIGTKESEYMGAINLDKSNEELLKSVGKKTNKTIPFNCFNPSECSCENLIEAIQLESLRTKKEKHNEIIADRINKHQTREITVLKNIQKKERFTPQSREKVSNNKFDSTKTNANIIDGYQIHFLGVTLADANPPITNKVLFDCECDLNILTGNTLPQEENKSNEKRGNKELYQNEVYVVKNNTDRELSGAEYSSVSNSMKRGSKNILKNKTDTYAKNEDNINKTNEEDKKLNKYKMQPDYVDRPKVNELSNNNNYKHDEQIYSNEQKVHDVCVYPDEGMLEDKDITQHLGLTYAKINGPSEKPTLSCQCSVNLAEFKNFLDVNIGNQITKDVALDVPSFKHLKNNDESCVCCNNISTDESKDLEENAFHLLEEYLKKKLDEFKGTSCSSLCIPPMEEEKLFTVILQRVKQVIADSTNQITCKCLAEGVKTQGSWNRAYGLLQEYLKIKIKKVQCSCLLAEDNKNTILPNVLDKVGHLIEYDFQRLKDVCGYKNDPGPQKNTETFSKQGIFTAENPEKDTDVLLLPSKDNAICPQTIDDFIRGNEIQSQATIGTNGKEVNMQVNDPINDPVRCACHGKANTVETNCKKLSMQASTYSFNKYKDSQKIIDARLLGTKLNENNEKYDRVNVTKEEKSSQFPASSYIAKCMCVCPCVKNINNSSNVGNKTTDFLIDSITNDNIQHISYMTNASTITSVHLNNKHALDDQADENKPMKLKNEEQMSACMLSCNLEEKSNAELTDNAPYIGNTIDCGCDCSKSITSKAATDNISNIIKNSFSTETNLEKVSHIEKNNASLHKNMSDDMFLRSILKKNAVNDSYFHECQTSSSNADEILLLNKSIENVTKTHAKTNTQDDITSIDTDYSNNKDTMDWCDYSQCNTSKNVHSEQLKNSLYFPVPLVGIDDEPYPIDNSVNPINELPKRTCECEMVPICHVKMLVKSIENKLANAKCTCDSLIPKVCPVHSTK